MVELCIERDNEGRYCLNEQVLSKLSVRWGNSFRKRVFWITGKDKNRCIVKYTGVKDRSFSLLGELIFSKFAERNNVPSAKIDVAYDYDKNELAIISQNICGTGRYDESLDLGELVGRYSDFGRGDLGQNYSVKNIYKMLKNAARNLGVSVQPNMYERLKEICLIDYLVGQEDRNQTNIMFDIVHTGSDIQLRLCPLFDNEYAFCFGGLIGYGDSYEYGDEENIKNVANTSLTDYCLPLMGINRAPKSLKCLVEELAIELNPNSKLKRFYNSLNFDFKKVAEEINAETGYVINEDMIEYCEQLVKRRKSFLDKVLSEQRSEEKGD